MFAALQGAAAASIAPAVVSSFDAAHREYLRVLVEFRAANDRLGEAYDRYVEPDRPTWKIHDPSGHETLKGSDGRAPWLRHLALANICALLGFVYWR